MRLVNGTRRLRAGSAGAYTREGRAHTCVGQRGYTRGAVLPDMAAEGWAGTVMQAWGLTWGPCALGEYLDHDVGCGRAAMGWLQVGVVGTRMGAGWCARRGWNRDWTRRSARPFIPLGTAGITAFGDYRESGNACASVHRGDHALIMHHLGRKPKRDRREDYCASVSNRQPAH